MQRLAEGDTQEEEIEDPMPTVADLSIILQPNSSHVYLDKQAAIMVARNVRNAAVEVRIA